MTECGTRFAYHSYDLQDRGIQTNNNVLPPLKLLLPLNHEDVSTHTPKKVIDEPTTGVAQKAPVIVQPTKVVRPIVSTPSHPSPLIVNELPSKNKTTSSKFCSECKLKWNSDEDGVFRKEGQDRQHGLGAIIADVNIGPMPTVPD